AKKIALDASKARCASRKPGGRHKGNQAAKSPWRGAADLRPLAKTKKKKTEEERRHGVHSESGWMAFVVKQAGKEFAQVARRIEMTYASVCLFSDRECHSIELGHDRESRFVGDIIADEKWPAAGERLLRHQLADAACLGEARTLDLADVFSRQHFDRRSGELGLDERNRGVDHLLRLRRPSVM